MRKLLMFVLIVAMLLMGGTVIAQDSTTFCGGLGEADCALLTASQQAMQGLTSSTFNFNLDIAVDGADGGTLSITGEGAFAGDYSGMDTSALQSGDMTAMFDTLKAAIAAFKGDLSLSITLPQDPGIGTNQIDLELMMVDGVGYINFATIAPLLGGPATLEAMGLPTEWAGLDFVDVIEQATAMMGPQLEEMQGQLGGATSAMDPSQYMAFANYMTLTREADADGAAVFSGSLDLAGLLADPAFMEILSAQMAAQGQEIPQEQLDQMGPMMAQMAGAFNVSITERIDLATNYLRGLDFNFSVDGAALSQMGAGTAPNITVTASFNFADFNAAPEIAAPAGAPVATFMQLIGLFSAAGQ